MFSTGREVLCSPLYSTCSDSDFLSDHNPVFKFVLAFIFYPPIKVHLLFFFKSRRSNLHASCYLGHQQLCQHLTWGSLDTHIHAIKM